MITNACRVVVSSLILNWQVMARPTEAIYMTFQNIAGVAVFAWLARISGRQEVLGLVAFGVAFMVIWRSSVFHIGWQLVWMDGQGTLDFELMSRAPLFWVMFGKALAAFIFYGLIGIGCFAVALLIGGQGVVVANPPALVISLLVAASAVVATSFIFAPFAFLVRGQAGFFVSIYPIGILLSGFVQTTDVLPPVISFIAHAVPTSWAMEALLMSLRGEPWSALAWRWGVSLILCAATFVLAGWLFGRAESRVRELGMAPQ